MELKIDLLKEKRKSLLRVVLGILSFLVAIGWMITKIIGKEVVRPFDWVFCGIFALNGIAHFTEGLGYSLESFFGKAYVLINSEIIALKASIVNKEQLIHWDEIQSMEYKLNKFEIKKTDNTLLVINLSNFDYLLKEKIKQTIQCIAKEKKPPSTFPL